MLSDRVKQVIAGILVFTGIVSVVLSLLDAPVTICSGLNGVSTCAPPNYGSLAVYLAISAVFLIGGMYVLGTLRKSGKALSSGTYGSQ
jgi:hypothetical protein